MLNKLKYQYHLLMIKYYDLREKYYDYNNRFRTRNKYSKQLRKHSSECINSYTKEEYKIELSFCSTTYFEQATHDPNSNIKLC